jgi:hypothetical protein
VLLALLIVASRQPPRDPRHSGQRQQPQDAARASVPAPNIVAFTHYTPTYSSWLSVVENWLLLASNATSSLACVFTSIKDLDKKAHAIHPPDTTRTRKRLEVDIRRSADASHPIRRIQ